VVAPIADRPVFQTVQGQVDSLFGGGGIGVSGGADC